MANIEKQIIQGKGMGVDEYTIEDMLKAVPAIKEKVETLMERVKKDREERKDMSEADKFALGLPECSFEDEVFIKMKLKTMRTDGKLAYTQTGVNMGVAIFTISHRGDRKHDAIKKGKAVNKRKQEKKNKKKAKKSNRKK